MSNTCKKCNLINKNYVNIKFFIWKKKCQKM